MNGRALGMLGMAVLCGLGAMYGTSKLLSKDKAPVIEMQDVLVAAKDLKVEEVIAPEMVKVVQMPRASVPAGAFTSIKDVEARWVQYAILENDPIVERKLAARGSPPGLVSRIPKGMRAFAIEVNEQTGVSGFVLPDHRVDVVKLVPGKDGHQDAETVLEDVLVLASGQTFTRPDDRSIQARTVTLAVTPEQVDTLVAAKTNGALSLSLRGLNDHAHIGPREKPAPEEPPVVVAIKTPDPEPEPPPPPPPPPAPAPALPPPRPKFVTIYRGLDNMRRHQLGQSDPVGETDELAATSGPRPAPEADSATEDTTTPSAAPFSD